MDSRNRAIANGLAAACLAVSLAACDETLTAPTVSAGLAAGTAWRLESLERPGTPRINVASPDRFTLQFTGDGRVNALADCNRCTGGYAIRDNRVIITPLACTRVLCATAPFDTDYVNVLGGESTVRFEQRSLVLSSARGTLRFVR